MKDLHKQAQIIIKDLIECVSKEEDLISADSAWDIKPFVKQDTIKVVFPRPIKTSYEALKKFRETYNIQNIYFETNEFGDFLITLKF